MSSKATQNLDIFLKLCHKAQELIFEFIHDFPHENFFDTYSLREWMLELSPIEQIFVIANDIALMSDRDYLDNDMFIQEEIEVNGKKYRPDFIIFKAGMRITEEYSQEIYLKRHIIIELDGREYHSNKQQMNHDYQRENELKLAGYDVIRFTGSQIYNDVFGCISQICKYIEQAEKVDQKKFVFATKTWEN